MALIDWNWDFRMGINCAYWRVRYIGVGFFGQFDMISSDLAWFGLNWFQSGMAWSDLLVWILLHFHCVQVIDWVGFEWTG